MALVTLKDISLGFGGPLLFDRAEMQIERGERICLIGRNGTGKSTLLKILNGDLRPDGGTVTVAPGLKTSLLTQEVPLGLKGRVYDVVSSGQPHQKIQTILSRMGLDGDAECGVLSAGLRRRIYLARALVSDPDIFFWTNPRTIWISRPSSGWKSFSCAPSRPWFSITHDRAFLDRLATRIVEIDRGS